MTNWDDLSPREFQALRLIRNQLVHDGKPPSVRKLMAGLGFSSPRAAAYVLERLEAKGFVTRKERGQIRLIRDLPGTEAHAQTIPVPLVGTAPCGAPLLAEENIEAEFPVSTRLAKPPHRYFLLRTVGDSMTERGIREADLVLVRQQPTADEGDIVVALIDGEATIKEFHRSPKAVILKPRSKNKKHQPIVLTDDFRVLGVVVSSIRL